MVKTTASRPPLGDAVVDSGRGADQRVGFWGTGLHASVLAAVLALSTGAFLFWGGALWRVPPGTSHVGRITGSYLIVVPLVVAALAVARRLSFQHLLGSVASVWSAKLVITVTSYAFIAPGSATEYAPARTWEPGAGTPLSEPGPRSIAPLRAAEIAAISGSVLESGVAQADAAVVLGGFESSSSDGPSRDIPLVIERSRYGKAIYVASSRDRLLVTNGDGMLHTLRFVRDQRAVANVSVPPGSASHPISVPEPGAYEMSCENHPSERALLVVVDHNSIALTDSEGRFELRGVPAGEQEIVVLRPEHEPIRRTIRLAPGRESALLIELH